MVVLRAIPACSIFLRIRLQFVTLEVNYTKLLELLQSSRALYSMVHRPGSGILCPGGTKVPIRVEDIKIL